VYQIACVWPQILHFPANSFAGILDFLLPSQEEEDVALRLLANVYLDNRPDGRLQVVPLRLWGVLIKEKANLW
jgi:hypothetical protein